MIKPLFDNILIEKLNTDVTESGIVLPSTVKGERISNGIVTAIGTGKILEDGSVLDMSKYVQPGDEVLFRYYDDTLVTDEDLDKDKKYYMVMFSCNVVGVVSHKK